MPMHDWTKVPDGIFHAFHHEWISRACDALNSQLLPSDRYAMPEPICVEAASDVMNPQADDEAEFYRRKKSAIAIRHVSGDRVVAMIEIVSPGNKSNKNG